MINQSENQPSDEFADEFQQCDPCRSVTPELDPVARQGRQRWQQLGPERRQRLRRRRFTVIVTTAVTMCLVAFSIESTKGRIESDPVVVDLDKDPITKSPATVGSLARSKTSEHAVQREPSPAWFRDRLRLAGVPEDSSWQSVVVDLSKQPAEVQRRIVDWVGSVGSSEQQTRAMQLVGDAAGTGRRELISYWLQQESTRSAALSHALQLADPNELLTLVPFAKSETEKQQLCQAAWRSRNSDAASVLIRLATQPQWRHAIRCSAKPVSGEWVMPLLMRLRQRNWETRTATAFVLASIPGKQFDETVAMMVVQGRYRQPAYLALMSRDTPTAQTFLAQAANHTELAAGLYSARTHFAVMEAQLTRWKNTSQGNAENERSQNSHFQVTDTVGLLALDGGPCLDRHDRKTKRRG